MYIYETFWWDLGRNCVKSVSWQRENWFCSFVACSSSQGIHLFSTFPVSLLFMSGGQNIGASASVLPVYIQGWFPLGLIGLTSLQSKELWRVFSSTTVQKCQFLSAYLSLWSSSHLYMTSVSCQTMASTMWTFVGRVMSLFFNMLSRFVIAFLPSSMLLVTSWLQSPSTVTLELRKIVCHCFHCFPTYLPWSDGTGCHDFSVLNVE